MTITYFRPQKDGPEAPIENAVADYSPHLIPNEKSILWTAGSPPIGAGMPDLVVVSCEPQVVVLAQVELATTHILAYLRAVGCARLETIIERVGMPERTVVRCLNDLIDVSVVIKGQGTYSLLPLWRKILPEIVTIEVKVSNWRKAIEQASRNRIFAHRSFIALPYLLAKRVQFDPILKQRGIGLLSVNKDYDINLLRNARRHKPRVWTYYYQIASLVARHYKE